MLDTNLLQDDESRWLLRCQTSAHRYFSVWLELLLAPVLVLLHMVIRRAVEASARKILATASQFMKGGNAE